MSVAAHLGIDLAEYDARIRIFIPGYDALLQTVALAAQTLARRRAAVIVDLGIGTGALAAACLERLPAARVFAIDEDADMLAAARERLGRRLQESAHGSFETAAIPRCDVVIASLALHHVPTLARRLRLFRRVHRVLAPGGVLISADCHPPSHPRLAAAARADWLAHLEQSYTPAAARRYLRTWAREDHYVPIADETALLERAGFIVDIVHRRGAFAVLTASRG